MPLHVGLYCSTRGWQSVDMALQVGALQAPWRWSCHSHLVPASLMCSMVACSRAGMVQPVVRQRMWVLPVSPGTAHSTFSLSKRAYMSRQMHTFTYSVHRYVHIVAQPQLSRPLCACCPHYIGPDCRLMMVYSTECRSFDSWCILWAYM